MEDGPAEISCKSQSMKCKVDGMAVEPQSLLEAFCLNIV